MNITNNIINALNIDCNGGKDHNIDNEGNQNNIEYKNDTDEIDPESIVVL